MAANPTRHASLIRDILFAEALLERAFLRDDLHYRNEGHKQRWNEPRACVAKPDSPPDEQQRQTQIHRIPADPKNAARHELGRLARVHWIDRGPCVTKPRKCRDGDGNALLLPRGPQSGSMASRSNERAAPS